METSRLAMYLVIATFAILASIWYLAKEPPDDELTNLVHLLARH
ncbi:MAG: hypothetical protein VB050_11090 [Geobacteraceae bacterium]|nr:hypothetical protein [Geobacteraceae bacterium]